MGPIDRLMKFLTQQRPADMVKLFRPRAHTVSVVDLSKSQIRLDRTDVDMLLHVTEGSRTGVVTDGEEDLEEYLLHLEFIAEWTPHEALVSLAKAARAKEQNPSLPVISVALAFSGPKTVASREPVKIDWSQPKGTCIFTMEVLRIYGEDAQRLLESPLPALWALVPFSRGGLSRERVEETVAQIRTTEQLSDHERVELLAAIHIGLDHKGVLAMLQDIIGIDAIESSTLFRTAYSRGVDKGRMEGREEGREEGKEEGREEGRKEECLRMQEVLLVALAMRLGSVDPLLEAGIRRLSSTRDVAFVMLELNHLTTNDQVLRLADRMRNLASPTAV